MPDVADEIRRRRRVTITVDGIRLLAEVDLDEGDTIHIETDRGRRLGVDVDGATMTVGTWDADGEWIELGEADDGC
jgi:hypothetical protein